MPLLKEKSSTINDILNLPEGQRAELIDGQMYMMAAPSAFHQEILANLITDINIYIRTHNGGCKVYGAPFAVFLANDTDYVEPDLSVVCDSSKIDMRGCHGAPDWVIEIVSPSSRNMDYYWKLFKYRAEGVREYWIVDPEKDAVIVYHFEKEQMANYTIHDDVPVGIYGGDLQIRIDESVSGLQQ